MVILEIHWFNSYNRILYASYVLWFVDITANNIQIIKSQTQQYKKKNNKNSSNMMRTNVRPVVSVVSPKVMDSLTIASTLSHTLPSHTKHNTRL